MKYDGYTAVVVAVAVAVVVAPLDFAGPYEQENLELCTSGRTAALDFLISSPISPRASYAASLTR